MTIAGGQDAAAAADAANAWKAVRSNSDIQFTPLPDIKEPPPAPTPEWLKALGRLLDPIFSAIGRFLEAIFQPIGHMLGISWPIFRFILIALAIVLALVLVWHLAAPLIERWRTRRTAESVPEWTPDRAEAMALLEEADRLAAEGHYADAVHLLLRRSVRQITDARPDWLQPASTAREIAALSLLPEAGRHAFGVIAQRVERAFFALRDLDAQDWSAARGAYAQFAQVELRG